MNLCNRTSRLIITTQLYAYVVYAIIYRTLALFLIHSFGAVRHVHVCFATFVDLHQSHEQ